MERLMRLLGKRGVRRDRPTITTKQDRQFERAADLVDRAFTATRPDRLQSAELTYVPTRTETMFTAFVFDVYSRRIIGWRCAAANQRTDLLLDGRVAITRQPASTDPDNHCR